MHEYVHGVSIRLFGGPNNVVCLNGGEAGGMGEGWGDIFGTMVRMDGDNTRAYDFVSGSYVVGEGGVRNYPVSIINVTSHICNREFKFWNFLVSTPQAWLPILRPTASLTDQVTVAFMQRVN